MIKTDEEVSSKPSKHLRKWEHIPGTIYEKFSNVFEGLGFFEGLCSLRTDPSVSPLIGAQRQQPLALNKEI